MNDDSDMHRALNGLDSDTGEECVPTKVPIVAQQRGTEDSTCKFVLAIHLS